MKKTVRWTVFSFVSEGYARGASRPKGCVESCHLDHKKEESTVTVLSSFLWLKFREDSNFGEGQSVKKSVSEMFAVAILMKEDFRG